MKDTLRYDLRQSESFPMLNLYFSNKRNLIFFISLFLLVILYLLQFDNRISEGGDDASFLMEAYHYSKGTSFPSFHGYFYIMFLGWIIKLTGFNLILLKGFSFVFLAGYLFFTYLTFRNRISPLLLTSLLLFISFSGGIAFFGSQTYTEAFYMFLQSVLFYLFFQLLDSGTDKGRIISQYWITFLLTGFILFALSATRNIGLIALIVVLFVLIIKKRYWASIYTAASFLLFKSIYELYKRFVWNISSADLQSQFSTMLQKNPYNKAFGNETFGGLIKRFFYNLDFYLSKVFFEEMGFKSSGNSFISILITASILVILLLGLWFAIRNKKWVWQVVIIYLIASLGVTFISVGQVLCIPGKSKLQIRLGTFLK